MIKKLSDLTGLEHNKNPEINGITCDSRKVEPGFLFAALPGNEVDGADYINHAVERGASAILCRKSVNPKLEKDVALIQVDRPRKAYAKIVAQYYGAFPERVYAVTGTSGKSSVVWFVRQLLQAVDIKAASIGTMGAFGPGFFEKGSLTSPDPVKLHGTIQRVMDEAGVTDVALEASSHGLDQYRLDGLKVDIAAFTNFSHEHLDYHETLEAYLEAKKRLFNTLLSRKGVAVLNADFPEYEELHNIVAGKGKRVLSYGHHGSDLTILTEEATEGGCSLVVQCDGEGFDLNLKLFGLFQSMNVLCAIGMIIAAHPDIEKAKLFEAAATLKAVPGRMEAFLGHPKGAKVFVDYAHKPNALESVLKEVRNHTKGHVHVVFGCGGDRDKMKRGQMGKLAAQLADYVVITDDNPRSEDPADIRSAIHAQVPDAENIGNRREAIRFALSRLAPEDSLIIAGKGHETGQLVGATLHPFDDRDVAREEIKALEQTA